MQKKTDTIIFPLSYSAKFKIKFNSWDNFIFVLPFNKIVSVWGNPIVYDRKKSLLKTLTFGDYKIYLDKFWRPSTYKMINHQTGKSTDLLVEEIKFKVGLSERDFNQKSLSRVR